MKIILIVITPEPIDAILLYVLTGVSTIEKIVNGYCKTYYILLIQNLKYFNFV